MKGTGYPRVLRTKDIYSGTSEIRPGRTLEKSKSWWLT